MKKVVVFFALFALVLSGCGEGQKATPPGTAAPPAPLETTGKATTPDGPANAGETTYAGSINGDLGIHMRLKIESGKVAGSYYYDGVKTDIVLKGEVDGPQIRITEYDASGKETGRFYGAFVAPGRIEGVWAVANPEREGHSIGTWLKIHPFYVDKGEGSGQRTSANINGHREVWEGTWQRPVSTGPTFGQMNVSFVTDKSFWFEMIQLSGGSSGSVRGVAAIDGDGAVFRDGRGGEMRFTRKDGALLLRTNDKFSYGGYGVSFSGEFTRGETRRRPFYPDTEVLVSAAQEELFKKMTGPYYERFIDYFHLAGRQDSLDGPGINAFAGYMRGLAPYYQCIIMRSEEGAIWAALLTFVDRQSAVVYFTSDDNNNGPIPKTIEKWIADVQQKHERKLEVIRYH